MPRRKTPAGHSHTPPIVTEHDAAIVKQRDGQHYTNTAITITLDRPDTPRVARALHLLAQELNTTPTRLPGDPRPLTYLVDIS